MIPSSPSLSTIATWADPLVSPERKPPAWENVLHHLTWSLVRIGVLHRHRLSIQGVSNIPTEGPAVIVANHASMRVLGLSVITNLCRPDCLDETGHEEVLEAAELASHRMTAIVEAVLAGEAAQE